VPLSRALPVNVRPGDRRYAGDGQSNADSRIEVVLQPVAGGTRVTVHHRNVPDGHTSYRDGGWQNNYFEPMKRYFAAARAAG